MSLIDDHAAMIADRLTKGHFLDLVEFFEFPSMICIGMQRLILNSPSEICLAYAACREILVKKGMHSVESEVLWQPEAPTERYTVGVAYTYLNSDLEIIGRSQLRYYVERHDDKDDCGKISVAEVEVSPIADELKAHPLIRKLERSAPKQTVRLN